MERPTFDGPLLKTSSSRFQLNAPFLQNTGVYTRIFENAAFFIRVVVVLRPRAIARAMTACTCAEVIQPCPLYVCIHGQCDLRTIQVGSAALMGTVQILIKACSQCPVYSSLQCRQFWWSIECFAAILDSLQMGELGRE